MAHTHACVVLSLFLLLTFTSAQSPAPGPSVDCSSAVLSLADCLSFVQKGSTVKKPEGTCCPSLKTVLKEDATCLCEGLKSSASFGLQLDMAKALALPKACGVKAPPLSNCGISAADTGLSPASAPSPLSGDTPTGSGSSVGVPAPTPGATNSATKHHVPAMVSLLAGMAAVACF